MALAADDDYDSEIEAELAELSLKDSSVSAFNEDAFSRLPLREQFIQAQRLYDQSEGDASRKDRFMKRNLAQQALQRFMVLLSSIQRASLFSSNETVEEIATGDLKYLLTLNYIAKLHLDASDASPDSRLPALRESIRASIGFMTVLDNLGFVVDMDKMAWTAIKKSLNNNGGISKTSANNGLNNLSTQELEQQRAIKIAQFKKRKEIQNKMKVIREKMEKNTNAQDEDEDDNDVYREFTLLLIEDAIRETLSEFSMTLQEIDLLEQREKLMKEQASAESKMDQNAKQPVCPC
jgi:hypothetical protein